jgi:hypothetical protein
MLSKCVYQLPLAERSVTYYHGLLDTSAFAKQYADFLWIPLHVAFLPMN